MIRVSVDYKPDYKHGMHTGCTSFLIRTNGPIIIQVIVCDSTYLVRCHSPERSIDLELPAAYQPKAGRQ